MPDFFKKHAVVFWDALMIIGFAVLVVAIFGIFATTREVNGERYGFSTLVGQKHTLAEDIKRLTAYSEKLSTDLDAVNNGAISPELYPEYQMIATIRRNIYSYMEIEQMLANAFRDLSIQYTYLKPLRIPDISFDQKDKLLFLKGVSFPEFNDAKTTNDMSVYVAAFKQALQNNQVKIKSVADGKQYREDGTGTGSMLPMVDFEIALNPITHE